MRRLFEAVYNEVGCDSVDAIGGPLCEVRAEEAIAQDHRLAQTQQQKSEGLPTGSCMPIGLTARGDIVFPWECPKLIGKPRGPVYSEIQ